MSAPDDRVKAVFDLAAELPDPADRAALLDRECGGDAALRERAEALLRAHDAAGSFLARPPRPSPAAGTGTATYGRPDPTTAAWPAPPAEAGMVVASRYKLLEKIGEGGMGSVWMAEQTEPVSRRVAVKLIKAGMDTKQVVARFEQERQALALMDHPHIAKVLDGGMHEGLPFFIMELVKGQPITRYCDDKRLTVRDRLVLFADVCRAVQHAHQKGVIHRDIKPSNVLVAPYDGRPVVKVIDFGIAKATGQKLTDATLFTGFGAVVGTPEYMSPEQAELNNADVDTRSDVYGLGVLLYELLTGTTPLTRRQVKEAALLEVLRLVREEEPPRPSTRLSATAELPAIAAVRGVDPAQLSRLVRGELDWIVMKALEKDRARRYDTANGLAAEVDRYLAGEPVLAVPPSAAYRVRKFVRRNRGRVAAAAVLGAALMVAAGAVAASTGWVLADQSARRQAAEQAAHEAVANCAEHIQARRWPLALAEARRAETVLNSVTGVNDLRRETAERIQDLQLVSRLERVRAQKNDWVVGARPPSEIDDSFASAFRARGLDLDGPDLGRVGGRIRDLPVAVELALAIDDWATLRRRTETTLGKDWQHLRSVAMVADPDPTRSRLRAMIGGKLTAADRDELTRIAGRELAGRSPPPSLVHLGTRLIDADEWDTGVRVLRHAQQLYPDDFWANLELGLNLAYKGGHALEKGGHTLEAVRFLSIATALQPDLVATRVNLGIVLLQSGQVDEAIAQQTFALGVEPRNAYALVNLGHAQAARNDHTQAVASYKRAIELNPDAAIAHNSLGVDLKQRNDLDGALAALERATQLNPSYAWAYSNKASVLLAKGRWDDAIAAARRAIELKTAFGAPYHNLGKALYAKKDFRGAAEAYRQAIDLSPDLSNASDDLGLALAMQDDLAGAVAAFQQALLVNPKHVGAMSNLGFAYSKLDRNDEAIASFRAALQIQPVFPQVQRNLASALNVRAREIVTAELIKPVSLERALAMAREAVKFDEAYGPYWHTLGMAEFRARNWQASAAAMQEAMKRRKGGNAYEWLFLAMIHHELGEKDEARRWFDKSVGWMRELKTPDPFLNQFRREAEARLGVEKK